MAQHTLRTHPLVLRRLEVVRVTDVTPRMRRVTLAGAELGAFSRDGFELPGFVNESFDDHVKLVLASDDDLAAALPVQRALSIDWPPAENRRGRDYTPRRFDPDAGELDLDFVLHGDGPAASWAGGVRPGDELHLVGPKSSLVLPDGLDWVVLAGDETALPAIGRFLDDRPTDVPVQVLVEVADPAARQPLPVRDGDTVRWLHTPDGAPSRLAAAVRELDWWPGTPFVWAAGESRALLPLRRWLRRDRQLVPEQMSVTGYWHAEPGPTATRAPEPDAEELLSPLPWLATRAALDLGLLEVVGDRPLPTPELADRTGLAEEPLHVLGAYLASVGVLQQDADGLTLGPVAERLLGEDHLREELFGDGAEAQTLLALLELAPALRNGLPPWRARTGRAFSADADTCRPLYADRLHAAESLAFVAAAVADHPAWDTEASLTVTGPGSAALLRAVQQRGRLPRTVRAVAASEVTDLLATELDDLGVPVLPPGRCPPADLVVSTQEVRVRTDEELVAHLRGLSALAPRALVVDALERTGPGSATGSAEHDLLTYGVTGRGPRTREELHAGAAAAGWRSGDVVELGWDQLVFDLHRR